jgi:hypothetical protein
VCGGRSWCEGERQRKAASRGARHRSARHARNQTERNGANFPPRLLLLWLRLRVLARYEGEVECKCLQNTIEHRTSIARTQQLFSNGRRKILI